SIMIYTLSLHDALPIYSTKFIDLEDKSLMTKNFNTVLNSIKSTFNSLNNTEDYNNLPYVINVDGYNKPSQQAIRPNTKDFMSSLDQKSTRLNSSHVSIS